MMSAMTELRHIVGLLFLLTGEVFVQAENQAVNRLGNPGFESGITNDGSYGNLPLYWTRAYSYGTFGITNTVRHGAQALYINDTSASGAAALISDPVSVNPGYVYTACVWSRWTGSATGGLYLRFYNSSGTYISQTNTMVGSLGVWSSSEVTMNAPTNAATARIMLYSGSASTGTVYFDSASLVLADEEVWDGDFGDAAAGSLPSNWFVTYTHAGASQAVYSDGGNKVMRLVDVSTTPCGVSYKVPVTPRIPYRLSADARSSSASLPAGLYLRFYSNSTLLVTYLQSTTSATYTNLVVEGTAPSNATHATVLLYTPSTSTGTAYFDNISFQEDHIVKRGKFHNFGIPAELSFHRGAVVVEGPGGKSKLLISLQDCTGSYGLLAVTPETGASQFFDFPFETTDASFASLLSSAGRWYTQFGGYFTEFTPTNQTFTFTTNTSTLDKAMMLTEDDDGVVWAATYPDSVLMSFNPATREFHEYGSINDETWNQYPRCLAADDVGWIYVGIGDTLAQIVAYNPATGQTIKVVPEEERVQGSMDCTANPHTRGTAGSVWRGMDGYVYGCMPKSPTQPWFRLHAGQIERTNDVSSIQKHMEVAGSQFLFQGNLPDGRVITNLDVPGRTYTLIQTNDSEDEISFNYPTAGATIASVGQGSDGLVYGSSALPLVAYKLDPTTGEFSLTAETPDGGHINAVCSMGGSVYGAIYPRGILAECNTTDSGFEFTELARGDDTVLRPYGLIGLSNDLELVMFGLPGYGLVGGGLLFYNTNSAQIVFLSHTNVISNQCTKAMVELPNGDLLGGTTIEAGTGANPVVEVAELYVMKMPEREIIFTNAPFSAVPQYRDLLVASNGFVVGLATFRRSGSPQFSVGGDPGIFIFDPEERDIVCSTNLSVTYGLQTGGQAPRVMCEGTDGNIYILFSECIVRLNPDTFEHERVADAPVPVNVGIAIVDGVILFASGGEIWGYRIE